MLNSNKIKWQEGLYFPGVQLVVLVVHQKEGGAVGVDQLLCLVHDLQDQSVHADHLLEYRPALIRSVISSTPAGVLTGPR